MPTGYYVSAERKADILKLRCQGLSIKILSIRTGLRPDTIRKIVKKEEKQNGV